MLQVRECVQCLRCGRCLLARSTSKWSVSGKLNVSRNESVACSSRDALQGAVTCCAFTGKTCGAPESTWFCSKLQAADLAEAFGNQDRGTCFMRGNYLLENLILHNKYCSEIYMFISVGQRGQGMYRILKPTLRHRPIGFLLAISSHSLHPPVCVCVCVRACARCVQSSAMK
jgi:hypothetical protein